MFSIRQILKCLTPEDRKSALWVFAAILAMGIMEVVGVASIMPFVAIVGNPETIHENEHLSLLYNFFGFTSSKSFLIATGVGVSCIVLANLAVRVLGEWSIARFAQFANYRLSSRLFANYLNRPYAFFLNRHSANLGRSVLSEVQQVVNGAIMPSLNIAAGSIISLFLIALVLYNEPLIGTTALLVLGGGYAFVYLLVRGPLRRLGAIRLEAAGTRFQTVQESLNGIKDVKALQLEKACLEAYKPAAYRMARAVTRRRILQLLPNMTMQGVTFIGMMGVVLYFLGSRSANVGDILPTIVLFALAGSRIQTALNQVLQALSSMRFAGAAVDALYEDLTGNYDDTVGSARSVAVTGDAPREENNGQRIKVRDNITLDGVSFSYPSADRPSLRDISLTIPARTSAAFVGPTGAGKTTIVDILLGLLEPDEGKVLADGQPITAANLGAWQRNIGYVSQSIFLKDDTVAANIAFGASHDDIDMDAVVHAAKIANLHDFIMEELTSGYDTSVGDRGVRLSGGQRQRIGIARALYHDPDILIFDEATSALDNTTERAIMRTIYQLGSEKTVIMIAHRLSTVRNCSSIFFMEKGRVSASGKFDELIQENQDFKRLAEASE